MYSDGVGEGALRIHKPLHTDFTQLCSSKHWGDCAKLLLPSLFLPYPLLSELLLVLGGGLVTKSGLSLATAWTIAHQAPLYMEFSRQKYWNGLPFSSSGHLPDPGIKLGSPALRADSLRTESPVKLFLSCLVLNAEEFHCILFP